MARSVGQRLRSLFLGLTGAGVIGFGALVSYREAQVYDWRELAPGIEYRTFRLKAVPVTGDGMLHVVRLDPARVEFELGLASEDGALHRASDWAKRHQWSVVINAGMYDTDWRSNVGYLRHRAHVNNPRWKPNYESVLALDGPDGGVAVLDRDADDFEARVAPYRTVVQNLRTLKSPGVNVWEKSDRTWTEATVAQDKQGRVLFLFTGTRFSQVDFNERILELPLDLERAMHVEGGPEASLSIHTPSLTLDLNGETTVALEPTGAQWEIPNVIGVRSRGLHQ